MIPSAQSVIDRLHSLITFSPVPTMPDADLIADIDAINLLINLHYDLDLDPAHLIARLPRLLPELLRRIHSLPDIQYAVPLLQALHALIYGREYDQGPLEWRHLLLDLADRVVQSYRRHPLIPSTSYLFPLTLLAASNPESTPPESFCENSDFREEMTVSKEKDKKFRASSVFSTEAPMPAMTPAHRQPTPDPRQLTTDPRQLTTDHRQLTTDLLTSYLPDIHTLPLHDRLLRLQAYTRASLYLTLPHRDRWNSLLAETAALDPRTLTDADLLLWCDLTDQYPSRELSRRQLKTDNRQLTTDPRQLTTDNRQLTTDNRQLTTPLHIAHLRSLAIAALTLPTAS